MHVLSASSIQVLVYWDNQCARVHRYLASSVLKHSSTYLGARVLDCPHVQVVVRYSGINTLDYSGTSEIRYLKEIRPLGY